MEKERLTLRKARREVAKIEDELGKLFFGIRKPVRNMLIGAFSLVPYDLGHKKAVGQAPILLMAPPGYGKTGSLRGIANTITAKFSFVAGHPEMRTGEIFGQDEYDKNSGLFLFKPGPIFANIFLFDEVNRTHPKAQAMFLQAMEERIVVLNLHNNESKKIENRHFPLFQISDNPGERGLFFWVVATGNPFEQEGTYAIPEAQLDRFSMCFDIELPAEEEEEKIRIENVYSDEDEKKKAPEIQTVMSLDTVLEISHLIRKRIKFKKPISRYMGRIIHNSRPNPPENRPRYAKKLFLNRVDRYIKAGLSPRANFHFQAVARTIAFMNGRDFVSVDDIKEAARLVMPHRILLKPQASGRLKQHDIVEEILAETEVPSCSLR